MLKLCQWTNVRKRGKNPGRSHSLTIIHILCVLSCSLTKTWSKRFMYSWWSLGFCLSTRSTSHESCLFVLSLKPDLVFLFFFSFLFLIVRARNRSEEPRIQVARCGDFTQNGPKWQNFSSHHIYGLITFYSIWFQTKCLVSTSKFIPHCLFEQPILFQTEFTYLIFTWMSYILRPLFLKILKPVGHLNEKWLDKGLHHDVHHSFPRHVMQVHSCILKVDPNSHGKV